MISVKIVQAIDFGDCLLNGIVRTIDFGGRPSIGIAWTVIDAGCCLLNGIVRTITTAVWCCLLNGIRMVSTNYFRLNVIVRKIDLGNRLLVGTVHTDDFRGCPLEVGATLFLPITRVLASITRLANTRHGYEKHFILAEYLGPGYPGTR